MPVTAISFDLGQTLLELDETLLAAKARRRGFEIDESLVSTQQDLAWKAYNLSITNGKTGFDAWATFMRDLLVRVQLTTPGRGAPVGAEDLEAFVVLLWSEQPRENLWRKPISGMLSLLRSVRERGTKIGVLTNSEGRAKELLDATGFGVFVDVVVDSGVEGIDKPDRRLFDRLAERLHCAAGEMIHVGDSYAADVLGALGAGMTPIWFTRDLDRVPPPGVLTCRNADELQALLLARLG
jgi:FMN phosphatase YigB (HAD superfamily)